MQFWQTPCTLVFHIASAAFKHFTSTDLTLAQLTACALTLMLTLARYFSIVFALVQDSHLVKNTLNLQITSGPSSSDGLVCSPAMLAGQGTNLTGVPSLHSHKPSFPAGALGMSSLLDPHVASCAQASMASDSLDSAVVQSRAQCFGSGGDTGSVIHLEPGGHLQPLGMVGLHSPAPALTLAPLHATSPSAALAPPSTLSPKAGIAMHMPTSTSFSGGAPAEVGRGASGQGGKTHLPPPSPQSRAVKLAAQPGAARFK